MIALEENFRILRVTLESRFAEPAIFTVTSAHRADGAGFVAAGLARAFAEAGEETLLIGASEYSATAEVGIAGNARGAVTPLGIITNSPDLAQLRVLTLASSSRERPVVRDVHSALAKLRSSYRAIVIATDPIPRSASAYEFAREADGVLLAVRVGRSPMPADRELVRLLDESKVATIGVVPTRGRRSVDMARPPSTAIVPADSPRRTTRKIEVAS